MVKEAQFDVAYTYIYSPRPGTGASLLKDDIPLEVKKERLHILNDILRGIYQKKLPRLEGKIVEVLIDQKKGIWFREEQPIIYEYTWGGTCSRDRRVGRRCF